MKKTYLLLIGGLLATFFTGCVTTQSSYTSRVINIQNKNIDAEKATTDITVDFKKNVSATETQTIKFGIANTNQMMTAAYHKCIRDNKIDIVVDPIAKITVSPVLKENNKPKLFEKNYSVEIFGFAGYFKNVKSRTDIMKQLDSVPMDNIYKYKMLNDPSFSKDYFKYKTAIEKEKTTKSQNDGNGKTINLMLGNGTMTVPQKTWSMETPKFLESNYTTKSLAVKPQNNYTVNTDLMAKGKKQRNTGLILFGTGLAIGEGIGLTLFLCDDDDAMFISSITMLAFGNAVALTGIITAAVGGSNISKAKKGNVSFNYSVSPTNVGLALNF